MARIGYAKIGRSWKLDPHKGTVGAGDVDVARALHLLARLRPQDTFVLIGTNSGENPQDAGYPENVENPWTELRKAKLPVAIAGEDTTEIVKGRYEATKHLFDDLDAIVIWAGQHGAVASPIPKIGNREELSSPQVSFVNYASYLALGINDWRERTGKEEIWLCPDPRNNLKLRDLKWPLLKPVLAQWEGTLNTKHERYGDTTDPETWGAKWDPKNEGSVWMSKVGYAYSALELTCAPHPAIAKLSDRPHSERQPIGVVLNENRQTPKWSRLSIMRDWVLPKWPDAEIFGKWDARSLEKLGRPDMKPVPYADLEDTTTRWLCTITTPASGSPWATAKPWEAFAYGTVCFFHPRYDQQDHILRDAPEWLRGWLRLPDDPSALWARVDALENDPVTWKSIIDAQREHYEHMYDKWQGGVGPIMARIEEEI